jgi:hypothetical protein
MTGQAEPRRHSRRKLPPVHCHVCTQALGTEWVYVSARDLAQRLYALDLCGVCWQLLHAVIETEINGTPPLEAPEPDVVRYELARRRMRTT